MPLVNTIEKQGMWLFKYRSYLPLLLLVSGLLVYYFTLTSPSFKDINLEQWKLACLFISLLGLFIRAIIIGHTPVNTSGRNTQKHIADVLNTTGIYAIVRHPLYFGNFFMFLGIGMLTQNVWFIIIFILIYWMYYERIMFSEERFLERKFGNEYIKWAKKTPAFIPSLRLWKPSAFPFSFKNVLKREYSGFLNVFLVFFVFEIEQIIVEQRQFSYANYWLITLIAVFVISMTLRTISKTTRLLHVEGR